MSSGLDSLIHQWVDSLRDEGFSESYIVGYLMAAYAESLDQLETRPREMHMRLMRDRVDRVN